MEKIKKTEGKRLSTRKVTIEGKRFSQREVTAVTNEHGDTIYFQKINWDAVYGHQTLERYRERAIDVLNANGVDVAALLEDAPHGSLICEHVLVTRGETPDSVLFLAAKIVYLVSHILAYEKLPGYETRIPDLAYDLGRVTAFFEVFQIYGESQGLRRRGKPLASDFDTTLTYDKDRDNKLRKFHKRLAGQSDATTQTAKEFDLSTRQVRRILKKNSK